MSWNLKNEKSVSLSQSGDHLGLTPESTCVRSCATNEWEVMFLKGWSIQRVKKRASDQ